jgi:hypothetical protein
LVAVFAPRSLLEHWNERRIDHIGPATFLVAINDNVLARFKFPRFGKGRKGGVELGSPRSSWERNIQTRGAQVTVSLFSLERTVEGRCGLVSRVCLQ